MEDRITYKFKCKKCKKLTPHILVNLSRKFGRKIQCQICGTSTYTKRKLEEYISEEEKNEKG